MGWCENHNDLDHLDMVDAHYRREALREKGERLNAAWASLGKYAQLPAGEVSDEALLQMEYLVRIFGRRKACG